jgi:hypothetical protein
MISIQTAGGSDNRITISVYNMTASTLARGAVVCYYASAAGLSDGISVTTPASNMLDLVAGIVADTPNSVSGTTGIATLTSGFIVVYGVTPYATIYATASVAPAIGDKLVPVAGSTVLQYVAAGDGRDGMFVCLSTYASSTGTQSQNISVFVRAA